MKPLDQLLSSLEVPYRVKGSRQSLHQQISSITADSREVRSGSLFVALRGEVYDGHAYIEEAVARGCCALVVEREIVPVGSITLPIIQVKDSHQALGELAAAWYDNPAQQLTLIGLTGTNGKTTTSYMIEGILRDAGYRTGVIGTVNYRYLDKKMQMVIEDAPLTTPGPVLMQQLLAKMVAAGVSHVVMEISSHALVQKRLAGVRFDVAVFTNLSRDHLDFHPSMEAYFAAKSLLFQQHLVENGHAVIVVGTKAGEKDYGQRLVRSMAGKNVLSCGFDPDCRVTVNDWRQDMDGIICTFVVMGTLCRIQSAMIGRFNILNMLAAAGVGQALHVRPEEVGRSLSHLESVPGRLERVRLPYEPDAYNGPAVFVDYAHTPDALENVLSTLREVVPGRLICVFGCGGDRDQGKRSFMGEVVGRHADVSLVTSDNPRKEDGAAIIADILPGIEQAGMEKSVLTALFGHTGNPRGYLVEEDRRTAITSACSLATKEDAVLLAGKGHEDYQLIADQRLFFDDRLEAMNGLLCWNRDHLLAATGGKIVSGSLNTVCRAITTDTRTLQPGDIFVALAGDRFDGHDYLDTAGEKGAAVVVVDRECRHRCDSALVIQVDDTLKALGMLANYRRRLLGSRVLVAAITGSSGKTTVKEMTAAIFSEHLHAVRTGIHPVLKTQGNLNNLIGLPLSLLPLAAGHRMAVLEMGMNMAGEIARLTSIADPDLGCITNIQGAHLAGLGSIEGVAQAKGELFANMRPGSYRIINFDDPACRRLAKTTNWPCIGFAITAAGRRYHPEVRATRIEGHGADGMRFTLHVKKWQQRLTVASPGLHSVANCTAAAAIAHAAGVAPENIVAGLQKVMQINRRMEMLCLAGGLRVANDCYNANPASMAAALRTVATFGNDGRHLAVLGDMFELGKQAEQEHEKIGRLVAELEYTTLLLVGRYAETVAKAARSAGLAGAAIHIFTDTDEVADWLYQLIVADRLGDNDWLLLKGSRGMRMERVLDGLKKRFDDRVEREERWDHAL